MPKCKYEDCSYDAELNHDLCIFHNPKDKKQISNDDFNKAITYHLYEDGIPNCDGFIFPADYKFDNNKPLPTGLSFKNAEFHGHADFSNITFQGKVDFEEAIFKKGTDFSRSTFTNKVNFNGIEFLGKRKIGNISLAFCVSFYKCSFEGDVEFTDTKFLGGDISFSKARFNGKQTYFKNCTFAKGSTNFDECIFKGKDVLFFGTKFNGGHVFFTNVQFICESTKFISVFFLGGVADFSHCSIDCDFRFSLPYISYGIEFVETVFGDKASFHLADPNFSYSKTNNVLIFFKNVKFIPFQTFFELIDPIGKYIVKAKHKVMPLFAFRQCYLKDVYFSNCNLSLFSFYKSAFFEESFFGSCTWPGVSDLSTLPHPFKDRIRICEEIYLDQHNEFLDGESFINLIKRIQFPDSHLSIAELYLRFKASADRAKDYHLASRFYFNEFEMKRKFYSNQIKGIVDKKKRFFRYLISGKFWLYNIYKLLAGYGEKPIWSAWWFVLLTFIFSIFHLFNGFKIGNKVINYDWSLSKLHLGIPIGDFFDSVLFTLYRIIPTNYLPFKREEFSIVELGTLDLMLSFLNTFVLVLLIIFIGIGLKRHFRRF